MSLGWSRLLAVVISMPIICGAHPTVNYRATNVENASQRYGLINKKTWTWADQEKWIVSVPLSQPLKDYKGRPVNSIKINRDAVDPLQFVLEELAEKDLLSYIKMFYGSLYVRSVRGRPDKISTHAYGLSLDFNAHKMPRGSRSKWPPAFVEVWEKHGWCWGGRWDNPDPMHFSWAWECEEDA